MAYLLLRSDGKIITTMSVVLLFIVVLEVAALFTIILFKDTDMAIYLKATKSNYSTLSTKNNKTINRPIEKDDVNVDTTDWKSWQNNDFGVELSYPKDWYLSEKTLSKSNPEEFAFLTNFKAGLSTTHLQPNQVKISFFLLNNKKQTAAEHLNSYIEDSLKPGKMLAI